MGNLVIIYPSFSTFFSFISNVFIKIHEYSNYISLATIYKIRVLCLSITVISSVLL